MAHHGVGSLIYPGSPMKFGVKTLGDINAPVFIGRQTKTAVGSTSSGLTFDLTTISSGDLGLTGDLGDSESLAENDLVIIIFGCGSNTNVDLSMVTAGYTERQDSYANSTYDANIGIFYKFMGSTPDTSAVTTNPHDVQFAQAGQAYAFRGIDTTTPFDVSDASASSTSSIAFNPPSITPTALRSIILVGAIGGHNDGGTGNLYNQAGSGDTLEGFGTTARNDTIDVLIGSGFHRWTSGAFNPGAWTYDGGDDTGWSHYGYALALRPAV